MSGSAAADGAKAPKKSSGGKGGRRQRMSRDVAQAVRAVESAWPEELAALLPGYRPAALRDAIVEALDCRSAKQLGDRIRYRWHVHGFANDLLSADGRGLKTAVGVAVALVRPSTDCPDPMCEDGTMLDTGVPCRACLERRADRRSGAVPRQGGKVSGASWECEIPTCRTPGTGPPPEDGLCSSCRAELDAATLRLQAANA